MTRHLLDTQSFPFLFSKDQIARIQAILRKWGHENFMHFPWRNNSDPWQGLVVELLLQRTRAQAVVGVYAALIENYPTPDDMVHAPLDDVRELIYPLGLPYRANLLQQLAVAVVKLGQIPANLEELQKLPGVGAYVASAWLSFHANKRAVIIDANVVRWLCRMIDVSFDGETRRKKWFRALADSMTPTRSHRAYNYAVLDFAMQVCKPSTPECWDCPLARKYCQYSSKRSLFS